MIKNTAKKIAVSGRETWITLLLAALYIPFVAWMPVWTTGCFYLLLLWKAYRIRKGYSTLSRPYRLRLALTGLALVIAYWGAPLGLEPGAALLFLMLGLKTFEHVTAKAQVTTLLMCLFPLLAGTLFSPSFVLFIYNLGVLAGILLLLQGLQLEELNRDSLQRTGSLLLQALPLALVLFLLFPRVGGGILSLPQDSETALTGLSETMAPGEVSELVRSEEVAFRAAFSDESPSREDLYWRVLVLQDYDGKEWKSDAPSPTAPEITSYENEAEYHIELRPTGGNHLVSLELPLDAPSGAELQQDFVLSREEDITSRLQYSLRSAGQVSTEEFPEEMLESARETAQGANPQTRELISELQEETASREELIRAFLQHFGQGDFYYSTSPPTLQQPHPVDDFLFRSQEGFCGHYAQALAWMSRAAGIPSRVVTGYKGGEHNPLGDYWIVRQSAAHAWVEVYLPPRGWTRKDPVESLSPDQILDTGQGSGQEGNVAGEEATLEDSWWQSALGSAGLAWDAVHFGWNRWVLGYTQQRQFHFLSGLKLGEDMIQILYRSLLLLTVLSFLFLLGLAALMLRGKNSPTDEVRKSFLHLKKKLRKAGLEPGAAEGPQDLARRIQEQRPDLGADCRKILDRYIVLRYAEKISPGEIKAFKKAVRRFSPRRRRT